MDLIFCGNFSQHCPEILLVHKIKVEIWDATLVIESGIMLKLLDGPIFSQTNKIPAKPSPWKNNKLVWQKDPKLPYLR